MQTAHILLSPAALSAPGRQDFAGTLTPSAARDADAHSSPRLRTALQHVQHMKPAIQPPKHALPLVFILLHSQLCPWPPLVLGHLLVS